ncbi:hypothetical protein M1O16_05015 [Dehalococcoidia bacterium]|nr:hypothetical protein [Dehalococcoidia bacterium]
MERRAPKARNPPRDDRHTTVNTKSADNSSTNPQNEGYYPGYGAALIVGQGKNSSCK